MSSLLPRGNARPVGYPGAFDSRADRQPEEQDERGTPPGWLIWCAVGGIGLSIALFTAVGLHGPSAAVPQLPSAPTWPLIFVHASPMTHLVAAATWSAALAGAAGLGSGLLAVRRGWRPRPRLVLAWSLIAVVLLMLVPPIGSRDMLDDAVFGRIAALGHDPYTTTARHLQRTGDPIAMLATRRWRHDTSPYGPVATLTQELASKLGGSSAVRTLFWLKLWNALAFLAVALALDRYFRSDPGRRARAQLLWTVNPLMLLAVVAGGHLDVLGVVFGVLAVLSLRRLDFSSGLVAGLLVGAAIAVKVPFALFGAGLAIAALRSPRALAGLAAGAAAFTLPAYALAGRAAITSMLSETAHPGPPYQPWQLLSDVLPYFGTAHKTAALATVATVVLAAVLLWRLPYGITGPPAARPVLALTAAWLICSPQQRAWYDVMIFPVLALLPASRLDWIVLGRSLAGAIGQLPGVATTKTVSPLWLVRADNLLAEALVPATLVALTLLLLWLCLTDRLAAGQRWTSLPPASA